MSQTFRSEKKTYTKGSVIILQGSSEKDINLLNQGIVEIKRCRENINGMDETDIIKKSKRIQVIQAPTIFGVENLINQMDHQNSFIALQDCVVTKYIIPSDSIISFFKVNSAIAMNILLTMKDSALRGIMNLKKYSKLIGEVSKVKDNFLLLHSFLSNEESNLYKKFVTNGGVFPPNIEPSFLIEDFSTILGVTYGEPDYNPGEKFNGKKLEFYHHLLKSKPDAFISLINTNQNILSYIYHDLSTSINDINIETEQFSSKLEDDLNQFFDNENSSFNKLVKISDKIKTHKDAGIPICNAIVSLCRNIDQNYKQLTGLEHTEVFSKYDKLTKQTTPSNGTDAQPQKVAEEKYKKLLKDSTKKIVEFSTLSEEKKEIIYKNILGMNKIDYNDPTAKESRQIIKKLQDDFFELYYDIFMKIMDKHTGEIPIEVKMFLFFAFIDEKLITEEQAEFLYNSVSFFTKPFNSEFKIISLFDYLKLIYEGEESPSLTETGEIFSKVVKKVFLKNEKVIEDNSAGRTSFEVDNMVKSALRITSDNLRAYIPYISSNSFKGNFSKIFISPKKLETFINKVVSLDYSLFFRETTWKIPGKSELIKKEVKPYLILVPNSGQRVQMWQEIVNNVRSTRGRFIIPTFFNGDLNKSLIMSCAHFRWELNKTIVGSNWMDPVEGGLVGSYYDYSQYYDKYKDLSLEAKELIKTQFMRIKIDRDRFAYDYYEWLEHESKSVPKLNKVVRAIFYKHIPFPKEIREVLAKLPLFTDLDTKFNNIRNREYRSLESRYHKYLDGGVLPEDLQAYLDLMKR